MIEIGFEFTAMSCPCEIRVVGPNEQQVHGAAQAGIDEVRRIEQKYSRYRPDSLLSRINAAAGLDPVQIDQETHALLQLGGHLHRASEGRFDLTSGVLRLAWDFRAKKVPNQAQIDVLLQRVGWSRVVLTPEQLHMPLQGMELDLGGIGKEYAADRAAEKCRTLGMVGGFVDLGGDIRVIGPRPDGSGWRFGVQDPFNESSLSGELTLTSGALATSGDYERGFEVGGKRYSHLLDARTGWPVTHWRSVSVAAPNALTAGMLATLSMLMGRRALERLEASGNWFLALENPTSGDPAMTDKWSPNR